jgi:hypothetical protein
MNRNMRNLSILIILLILIAGIGIVAAQNISGKQDSAGTQPQRLLYTKICCIQDKYYINYYSPEDYLQVPISVEVWDKNLKPVKAVKVNVEIYDEDKVRRGAPRFNQTKSTDTNGIVKFGYSEAYPEGPSKLNNPNWKNGPKLLIVWITNNNGYATYMEKRFEVDGD